jgi:hypothetical protein
MAAFVFTICFVTLTTVPFLMAATIYVNPVAESYNADVKVTVTVNTIKALTRVEDYFISYNIDCAEFDESFPQHFFRCFFMALKLLS